MPAPSLVVVPNIAYRRALILVTTTIGDTITLWRTSESGTAEVRGAVDIVVDTEETGFFDYELPQNVDVYYYVVGDGGTSAQVSAGQFDFGADVFFDLSIPAQGTPVTVEGFPEATRAASQDIVKVWDRSDPVVVSGERALPAGVLTLLTLSLEERAALLVALQSGNVIAFSPRYPEYGMSSPSYFSIGAATEIRPSPLALEPSRRWTLEAQEVLAPRSTYTFPVGSQTWQDVLDDNADWGDLIGSYWYDVAGL